MNTTLVGITLVMTTVIGLAGGYDADRVNIFRIIRK